MGAQWAKNEVVAVKRRCGMLIQKVDGALAPRGTDFMALGYVYVCGVAAPHFALAVGTLTNQRAPLTVADDTVESVDTGLNTLTLTAHVFETGDGPIRMTTSGTLPTGLALATDYWIVKDSANAIKLASSLANAYAGTAIDITATGSGTHTVDVTASTQRGVDGHFEYEATQAETNHDAGETLVIVNGGTDYLRSLGGGAYTTVQMQAAADTAFDQISEGALTHADMIRLIARTLVAKFSKTGNDYVYRDIADSKDSHSGTVTSAGRTARTILDPT
jgi:hypothetical protein